MADFNIEVPISLKGGSGNKAANLEEAVRKGLKRAGFSPARFAARGGVAAGAIAGGLGGSEKAIFKMAGFVGLILAVIESLDFIVKPILQLLKLFVVGLIMPFLPIIVPLIKFMAQGIASFIESGRELQAIVQKIIDFLFGGGLVDFVKNFFSSIWESLVIAWEAIIGFPKWVWENVLVPAFQWFLGVGQLIWNNILLPAWNWFKGIGEKIWNIVLLPAWNWFKNIGQKLWDIIKTPFSFFKNMFKNAINAVISFINAFLPSRFDIPHFAQGGVVGGPIGRPQLAVVHGGEEVIPAGGRRGGNITINNPSFRGEDDMRKLVDMISRRLQLNSKRGFS